MLKKKNQHISSLLLKDWRKDQYLFFSHYTQFEAQIKKKSVRAKPSTGKEIILKANKNLFSIMIIFAQSQQLDMKKVFSHPLGPIPWSLSTANDYLRKTNKASLSKYLEQLPAESLPDNKATIDAISIVQRIKDVQKTVCNIAKLTFNTMMAKEIDMVFDVYRNNSINNIEWVDSRCALTPLRSDFTTSQNTTMVGVPERS